jgi:LmbE family N-acetylglucosaminyl deacetylase
VSKAKTENRKERLVVMGAHPDDICCVGGIVAKYTAAGHKAYSLNVTLGETIRKPGPEQEAIKVVRREEGIEIARILGAECVYLDVPCNKIIPTMEMKMKLVNAIRRIGGRILLLFPVPWDVHADHRNLSWTMRDVVYYVGHDGIAADYPPCELLGAYMYNINVRENELHEPDFVIDITDHVQKKFDSMLCKARARAFSVKDGRVFKEQEEIWTRFWGMRHGVEYAEPLHAAYGSMSTMDSVRRLKLLDRLPTC